MKFKFLVQNPHSTPFTKLVDIDGVPTGVIINGFEVQLLSQDGMSGTLVRRFYGAAADEARALFVNDAIVEGEFTLVSAPEAAPAEPAAA